MRLGRFSKFIAAGKVGGAGGGFSSTGGGGTEVDFVSGSGSFGILTAAIAGSEIVGGVGGRSGGLGAGGAVKGISGRGNFGMWISGEGGGGTTGCGFQAMRFGSGTFLGMRTCGASGCRMVCCWLSAAGGLERIICAVWGVGRGKAIAFPLFIGAGFSAADSGSGEIGGNRSALLYQRTVRSYLSTSGGVLRRITPVREESVIRQAITPAWSREEAVMERQGDFLGKYALRNMGAYAQAPGGSCIGKAEMQTIRLEKILRKIELLGKRAKVGTASTPKGIWRSFAFSKKVRLIAIGVTT
ncbi:MAG: hypothetical protein A3G20_03930 [Acidobacteria bacterium RIFCSPLOWO2_12_FULL_59_11]|nr:MAG: hypothetical protein A3G20_03930 [Acidobacteria bacterium RIFCSPLOWO2_12_FULL_59_11]